MEWNVNSDCLANLVGTPNNFLIISGKYSLIISYLLGDEATWVVIIWR
jgi:hypothetical protein